MLKIYVLRDQETVHFAAAELKKYLRMMMPRKTRSPFPLIRRQQMASGWVFWRISVLKILPPIR